MPVELLKGEANWVLALSGIVDIFDAATLHAAAVEAADGAAGGVVTRLGSVEACDTSATQVLLALRRALAADGRWMRLEETPPPVSESWRLAGLGDEIR